MLVVAPVLEKVTDMPLSLDGRREQLDLQLLRRGLHSARWVPGSQDQQPSPDLIATLIWARPKRILGTGRSIDVRPPADWIDILQQPPDVR